MELINTWSCAERVNRGLARVEYYHWAERRSWWWTLWLQQHPKIRGRDLLLMARCQQTDQCLCIHVCVDNVLAASIPVHAVTRFFWWSFLGTTVPLPQSVHPSTNLFCNERFCMKPSHSCTAMLSLSLKLPLWPKKLQSCCLLTESASRDHPEVPRAYVAPKMCLHHSERKTQPLTPLAVTQKVIHLSSPCTDRKQQHCVIS